MELSNAGKGKAPPVDVVARVNTFRTQYPSVFWCSVTALVAVLACLVSVIVTFTQTAGTSVEAECPPVNVDVDVDAAASGSIRVDTDTGVVTNIPQTRDAKGTCVDDLILLNDACLQSKCTLVDDVQGINCLRPPNQTWDTYNPPTKSCVKSPGHQTCEQQNCDVAYCTSDTVQSLIEQNKMPVFHKLSAVEQNACINPGENTVAKACAAIPDFFWVYPNCVNVTPNAVINVEVKTSTTSLITGILSYPFLNDRPVLFTFSLSNPLSALTGAVIIEGPSLVPPANNPSANTKCFTFSIYLSNADNAKAGKYDLWLKGNAIQGVPYSFVSASPASVTLTSSDLPNKVYTSMNPAPSGERAVTRASDKNWVVQWLDHLSKSVYSDDDAFVTPLPLASQLADLMPTPSSSVDHLAFVATTQVCPVVQHGLLTSQLIVMAWDAVTVPDHILKEDPEHASEYVVRYSVTKRRDGNVDKEFILLSENDDTRNTTPAFLDKIDVGDVWTYTLKAFVSNVSHSWTNYSTSEATSAPVVMSVWAMAFPDEVCHSLPVPVESSGAVLPPWMWSTPQGCVWYPDNQEASDFYCALEYGKPNVGFNPGSIYLSTSAQSCAPLKQSYATVMTEWPPCGTSTSTADRFVSCEPALPLGTSGNVVANAAAFAQRMDNVLNFNRVHTSIHPAVDLSSIDSMEAQNRVYNESYYMCGPKQHPGNWASPSFSCSSTDEACQTLFTNAAGCSEDGNTCGTWQEAASTPTQLRFAQTMTCNST